MTGTKTHAEKTSADKQTIGIEYQYWFFLWRVLQLKTNESVGLEMSDDVHTDLADAHQILFQLKHSLKKLSDGSPERLTTYDRDLWKTLSNWAKIVSDPVASRDAESAQLAFIDKTDFVLVTNKTKAVDESIPDMLALPDSARQTIQHHREGTKNRDLQQWMDDVLNLSDAVLPRFISNISLEQDTDQIIDRCKTTLLEKQIAPERVEQLLRNLDSQIRQDNFLTVKSGNKVVITFEDFNRKYRKFFDQARSTRLQIRREYDPLPERLEEQTFIRQLLDIRDITLEDVNSLIEFSTHKKVVEKNLLRWKIEGDFTGLDQADFDRESRAQWKNAFRKAHRNAPDQILAAQECVDEVRKIDLYVEDQFMGIEFSNGQYYRLADIPDIGFLPNWEATYRDAKQ